MRVGKKLNVVEAKKTRSCVVRLEKVRSPPPPVKQTRGTITPVSTSGRTRTGAPPPSEEKTLKGPLKKRPITQVSTPVAATPKAKEKVKAPLPAVKVTKVTSSTPQAAVKVTKLTATPQAAVKVTKVTTTPQAAAAVTVTETPPTIAAGRSRRAIKPNPKYASDDIITPKIIRNVAILGAMTNKKNFASSEKIRKISVSSSEDFFNKESSDELDLDELVDKAYNVDDRDDSDSDFTDDLDADIPVVVRGGRGRGRPRKEEKFSPQQPRTPQLPPKSGTTKAGVATPRTTITTKSTPTIAKSTPTGAAKSTPSQLQILRKTLSASVNRIGIQSGATKRKLEPNDDNEVSVSRKRFTLNTSGGQYKPFGNAAKEMKSEQQTSINKGLPLPRKSLPSQALNGSKHNSQRASEDDMVAKYLLSSPPTPPPTEKRRTLAERIALVKPPVKVMGPLSTKSATIQPATPQNKSFAAKVQAAAGKQIRSASPANSKAAATVKNSPKAATSADNKKSVIIDDFETMPTFTIVNINDIINKKGDVLISKTAGAKNASTSDAGEAVADDTTGGIKRQRSESPTDGRQGSPSGGVAETKLSRRKAGHTTILSEKMDPERRTKTTTTARAPLGSSKKPAQTILNHTLANKSAAAANASMQRPKRGAAAMSKANDSISPEKPAPRILNAMVAKKTQPVKPMIANLDDSADESFPLSLEEEEDEIEEDDDDDVDDMDATTEEESEEDDDDDDEDFISSAKRRKLSSNTRKPYGGGRYTRKKTVGGKGSGSQPATKENSLAANNRMTPSAAKSKTTTTKAKTTSSSPASQRSKQTPPEKVVISRQGDKIIKKITCFETWYVINTPEERPVKILRNQLEIPLIKLANVSRGIHLPSAAWSSKVTLYELSSTTIAKSTLITYTGALREHNIAEEDRAKYQPSCVMFRRAVSDRAKSRLPYDRAVIFKNKTFFTNIEGKNVKMVAAPATISTEEDIEILLQIVDSLTLQSAFVEPATTVQ